MADPQPASAPEKQQQQQQQQQPKAERLALVSLPRVTIRFCTACKWNLRAAYYAQELLQTFAATLGEVALVPSSAGTFEIMVYLPSRASAVAIEGEDGSAGEEVIGKGESGAGVEEFTVWNRKTDGGFLETKDLKRRVRDLVDRERELGHVDRDYSKKGLVAEEREGEKGNQEEEKREQTNREGKEGCEDCK